MKSREERRAELFAMFDTDLQTFGKLLGLYGEAGYCAAVDLTDPARPCAALVSDVEAPPFRETAPDFPHVAAYPTWIAFGFCNNCVQASAVVVDAISLVVVDDRIPKAIVHVQEAKDISV